MAEKKQTDKKAVIGVAALIAVIAVLAVVFLFVQDSHLLPFSPDTRLGYMPVRHLQPPVFT